MKEQENPNWRTSQDTLDMLYRELNIRQFDLDICADINPANHFAKINIIKFDNNYHDAKTIYCNPPGRKATGYSPWEWGVKLSRHLEREENRDVKAVL